MAEGTVESPVEILAHYVFEGVTKRLPRINAIVDLYNVWSLRTGLSIGAHDLDKLSGSIRLAIAKTTRTYLPLGATEPVEIHPGEYLWHDDANVLCRLDVKQGDHTKVGHHSRHVVLIVQGNSELTASVVRSEAEALCRAIVSICGGEFRIVASGGPSVEVAT